MKIGSPKIAHLRRPVHVGSPDGADLRREVKARAMRDGLWLALDAAADGGLEDFVDEIGALHQRAMRRHRELSAGAVA